MMTTDKDDHDLNRPIGRIAAKPFIATHDGHENHTIFRPEEQVYGETPHGFHSTVSNWFHEHYPAKEGVRYSKDNNVYNDGGNTNYSELSHQEIEEKMRRGHAFETKMPKKNVNHIFKTLMEKTISKDDPNIMDRYAENRRNHRNVEFDRNQINDLYKTSVENKNLSMTNHISNKYGGQLNKENLSHALDLYGEHRSLPQAIVGHKYLPKEVIDKIPTSQLGELHKSNITDAHVQRAIDSYKNHESGSSYVLNDINDHIKPEHLKDLINHEITNNNPTRISSWLSNKNANEEVINHTFNQIKNAHEPSEFMTYFNRHNQNPTPEHVAMTNSVSGLNDVMRNAKDKTTHNLAFYKAHELKSKNRQYIALGNNSDKYIGEPELEHMLQHPRNYNGGLAHMSDKIHSDLLHHHIKHINKLADEHENEEDEDKKAELEGKIDEHLENHASLIDDRLSDCRKDFIEGDTVNHKNLETLRDHIDDALEHPHHYHTHDDVDADHDGLMKEIGGNY